jgi:hypothetical protein
MRFINSDLLLAQNRYAYVLSNPMNYIDPLGLSALPFFAGYLYENNNPVFITPSQNSHPQLNDSLMHYNSNTQLTASPLHYVPPTKYRLAYILLSVNAKGRGLDLDKWFPNQGFPAPGRLSRGFDLVLTWRGVALYQINETENPCPDEAGVGTSVGISLGEGSLIDSSPDADFLHLYNGESINRSFGIPISPIGISFSNSATTGGTALSFGPALEASTIGQEANMFGKIDAHTISEWWNNVFSK